MNRDQKVAAFPESDYYYCAGDSKKTVVKEEKVNKCPEKASRTIFDTPDFVIDAYLDALNGGSQKDAGIRTLSGKYAEGNTNCNHNPKECPCSSTPSNLLKADYSCCGKESPYEKGAHAAVEDRKPGHCSSCDQNPYEKGESAFVEERKTPSCDCDCPYEEGESPFKEGLKKKCGSHCDSDCGNPYECGAFPFKEVNPNKTCDCPEVKVFAEKKVCCPCDEDIDKKFPPICSGASSDAYNSEENCSICVSKGH